MSVLIKDRHIPASCEECLFLLKTISFPDYNCMCRLGADIPSPWPMRYLQRSDNCPLVEVPAHGRLGDMDKLDAVLQNEAEPFGFAVYECGITDGLALARSCVETAPTIIPAEPAEETKP